MMNKSRIEAWAYEIIEMVKQNKRVEDSRVELKTKWPIDFAKAARQIAAHANTARGEEILWLIGIDEKSGLIGADFNELANWFPMIQSAFDGISPALLDLNIPVAGGIQIIALCFQTDRIPYVVKNPAFGRQAGESVEVEIPWREGTKTRSARRGEIILLSSPRRQKPRIELLEGSITKSNGKTSNPGNLVMRLQLYLVPCADGTLVFPFHRMKAILRSEKGDTIDSDEVTILHSGKEEAAVWQWLTRPNNSPQVTVRTGNEIFERTSSEVFFRGPARVEINTEFNSTPEFDSTLKLQVHISFSEAISEMEIAFNGMFNRCKTDAFVWDLWT